MLKKVIYSEKKEEIRVKYNAHTQKLQLIVFIKVKISSSMKLMISMEIKYLPHLSIDFN